MEKRQLYIKKLEEKLLEYDAKLTELEAKAADMREEMKTEYLSQIDSLETKREELAAKYEKLKVSGEQAWDEIKTGTEKAWDELEEAIEKAVAHFK